MQIVFNQGKSQRTISLNLHYSVIFLNGRGVLLFCIKAYQIWLNDGKWLVDFYSNASYKHYGYLFLNHNPSTPEDQTVVTNILPGEQLNYYKNSHAKS